MTFGKKIFSVLWLLLTALSAFPSIGIANTISIIVPFAPGGPTDVLARVIATQLSEDLKQPVIVENKAGATGAIGTKFVANAAPDGTTLLMATGSVMTTAPLLLPGHFDPLKDFTPISQLVVDENILVVHPSLPVKSVPEFIAYAKANPGALDYGTSGVGSSYNLGTELFSARTGIKVTHVPYKSTAQAMQDLIAGHVKFMFSPVSASRSWIDEGKMRPLGIASLQRHPNYPNLAPIAELAEIPGFEFATWQGLFVPAKTPQPVVQKISAALAVAMAKPKVKAHIAQIGMQTLDADEQEVKSKIKKELELWAKVIKDAGITIQ